eukprot:gene17532-17732_t
MGILTQQHAHEIAAVLIEPVQNRRPDLHPKDFLQKLRQGLEFIKVELKLGLMYKLTLIMAYVDGGTLTGSQAETTYTAGTYIKNPLSVAAARAILKQILLEGPQLQENLNQKTENMQANFYDTYGYVVIEDVFDEKTIEDVTTEIDDLEAEVEAHLKQMDGGKGFIGRAGEITFSTHLVKRPNVRLYWDHAVYKKPGVQKIFPWHQDNGYTFLEPQQYLT